MMIRWTISGMIATLLLGTAANAAPLSNLSGGMTAGASSAPVSSPGNLDPGLIKGMLEGHGGVWAQAACQKATEPCDDQHPCCGSLKCKATLFDKTKVCDFRG
jgi:hypothetical protein